MRAAFLLLAAGSVAGAQVRNSRTVQPERPTVATHAGTVAPGYFELEWGVNSQPSATSVPLHFKLGGSSRTQFGMLLQYDPDQSEFGPVGLEWKIRLTEHNPILGRFAIQPQVNLPSNGTEFEFGGIAIASYKLSEVALDLNVSAMTSSAGTSSVWTASFGGPVKAKWGWVAELHGQSFRGGPWSNAVLFGPTYSLKNWFSLDGGAVVPLEAGRKTTIYFGGVTNFGRIIGR